MRSNSPPAITQSSPVDIRRDIDPLEQWLHHGEPHRRLDLEEMRDRRVCGSLSSRRDAHPDVLQVDLVLGGQRDGGKLEHPIALEQAGHKPAHAERPRRADLPDVPVGQVHQSEREEEDAVRNRPVEEVGVRGEADQLRALPVEQLGPLLARRDTHFAGPAGLGGRTVVDRKRPARSDVLLRRRGSSSSAAAQQLSHSGPAGVHPAMTSAPAGTTRRIRPHPQIVPDVDDVLGHVGLGATRSPLQPRLP